MKLCAGTALATASFIYGGDIARAADIDTVYSTFETYNGDDLEILPDLPCGRLKRKRQKCISIHQD